MPADELEQIAAQALTEQGGPPEIAPQVVAIAREKGAEKLIVYWIRFHRGEEWSAIQFRQWLEKYAETERSLAERRAQESTAQVFENLKEKIDEEPQQ